VAQALLKLQVLESSLRALCQEFDKLILIPRLGKQAGGDFGVLHIEGNDIRTTQKSADASLQALFSDLCSMIEFLRTRLPPIVTSPLSGLLKPDLVSRVILIWLSSAVPTDLDDMQHIQETVDIALLFAQDLESCQWPGADDLVTWTEGIPRVWLEKRRETSLDNIRKLLAKGLGEIKTVERVETQKLSRKDDVLAVGGGNDDWNAEWSDEEGKVSTRATAERGGDSGDDEDVSAWGLDDETHDQKTQEAPKLAETAADDADAWGWGDDADIEEPSKSSKPAPDNSRKSRINGHPDAHPPTEREITLKETFNITSLPSEVLDFITQVMSDAERLEEPK